MKAIKKLLAITLLAASLAACTSSDQSNNAVAESSSASSATSSSVSVKTDEKTLVVYFSMPETDNPDNMSKEEDLSTVVIDGKVYGNTQYFANVIAEDSNADIYRIEPETPYPTDHETLVDQAKEEQSEKARPSIKDSISNFEQYDTIFIGYPIWWYDMPMIMYTFFETYDFSGKTIIPFDTSGGSGLSGTVDTIRQLEPNADVKDGMTISRTEIQDARNKIDSWMTSMGFEKGSSMATNNTTAAAENSTAQMKMTIDSIDYSVTLEDNDTSAAFKKLLPEDFAMTELNGNEKYIYLNSSLPSNAARPEMIHAGDIMLYGDNCIVLFYKDFTTTYSYTKIGHVEGFDEDASSIGSSDITVHFE